jgi:hypothetical protein
MTSLVSVLEAGSWTELPNESPSTQEIFSALVADDSQGVKYRVRRRFMVLDRDYMEVDAAGRPFITIPLHTADPTDVISDLAWSGDDTITASIIVGGKVSVFGGEWALSATQCYPPMARFVFCGPLPEEFSFMYQAYVLQPLERDSLCQGNFRNSVGFRFVDGMCLLAAPSVAEAPLEH